VYIHAVNIILSFKSQNSGFRTCQEYGCFCTLSLTPLSTHLRNKFSLHNNIVFFSGTCVLCMRWIMLTY